jgi:hypothetical protein
LVPFQRIGGLAASAFEKVRTSLPVVVNTCTFRFAGAGLGTKMSTSWLPPGTMLLFTIVAFSNPKVVKDQIFSALRAVPSESVTPVETVAV